MLHNPHNCHIRKDETTIFFLKEKNIKVKEKDTILSAMWKRGKISNIRESLSIHAAVKRERRRRNNENEI